MNFVQYFVNLGPAVMLPIVIFIVGLVLGQSAGKALRSGISIGIGFIGIGLVISLMLDNLAPAAQAMSANFGISMNLIDVGWPGTSPLPGPVRLPWWPFPWPSPSIFSCWL
ncbi:PTS transporter subunit IIC [Megasphaera sp.]|uniref:PTS transporter subunit IIC n=1 Tax=Megasphaera sp. TaxID=2023260 RepID=UPI0027BA7CB2|nr:PTS transporter subunit IIC [Megasphaera sp.]